MSKGYFVWNDLMTSDLAAVLPFYQGLLGWTTDTSDMGTGPYTMFKAGDKHIGGVTPGHQGQPYWVSYISVDDVDAARHQRLHDPGDAQRIGAEQRAAVAGTDVGGHSNQGNGRVTSAHAVLLAWCRHPGSNWGPTAYKAVALPTELCRRHPGILAQRAAKPLSRKALLRRCAAASVEYMPSAMPLADSPSRNTR